MTDLGTVPGMTLDPTYDFNGQVALVTGAASGMGLATARAFAASGAAVVLVDVQEDRLASAVEGLESGGHTTQGSRSLQATPRMSPSRRSTASPPSTCVGSGRA